MQTVIRSDITGPETGAGIKKQRSLFTVQRMIRLCDRNCLCFLEKQTHQRFLWKADFMTRVNSVQIMYRICQLRHLPPEDRSMQMCSGRNYST